MVARHFYYQAIPDVPDWKLSVSASNVEELGLLVPPVLEASAAAAYLALGGEELWAPRLITVLSWLAGGWFLYLIAMRIATPDAAVISIAFYLFLPSTIPASQSFQPDAPMVAATVAGVYAILSYNLAPSIGRLAAAILISGLAILLKGIAVFFVFAAFFALTVDRLGLRGLFTRQTLFFGLLSFAPTAAFYGYVASQDMLRHSATGFIPSLMLEVSFWKLWLGQIHRFVGLIAFAIALLGIVIARPGYPRMLLLGLWGAYFAYGISKTYHIYTHDYYQLVLVPVVALSLAPLVALIAEKLSKNLPNTIKLLPYGSAVAAAIFLYIYSYLFWDAEREASIRRDVAIAREIGEAVGHDTNVIILGPHEERFLRYHGEFSGSYWPDRDELDYENKFSKNPKSFSERWQETMLKKPSYFVVRNIEQYRLQPELQNFMESEYPVIQEIADDYMVFDLRKK